MLSVLSDASWLCSYNKCHGNSKSGTPFHPVKQRIKEECGGVGPKRVVATLSAEAGGVIDATAPGQLPRDEKQVTNFRAKVSLDTRLSSLPGTSSRDVAADDLFIIIQKAFTEDPSRKFIRAVNAAPAPARVVSTDRQLLDLARFCTGPEFCPLTVDPTFCLGEFDVTLITYQHLLQSKRYKNPPVSVGPCCIHYKKSFSTYLFFAASVIGQC